jgi:hypothetical protein
MLQSALCSAVPVSPRAWVHAEKSLTLKQHLHLLFSARTRWTDVEFGVYEAATPSPRDASEHEVAGESLLSLSASTARQSRRAAGDVHVEELKDTPWTKEAKHERERQNFDAARLDNACPSPLGDILFRLDTRHPSVFSASQLAPSCAPGSAH